MRESKSARCDRSHSGHSPIDIEGGRATILRFQQQELQP